MQTLIEKAVGVRAVLAFSCRFSFSIHSYQLKGLCQTRGGQAQEQSDTLNHTVTYSLYIDTMNKQEVPHEV